MFSIFFTYWAVWSPYANLCSLSGGDHCFGDCCYLGRCFCLHGRADVGTGVGGIGQSFLVSNRFSEVDPPLGQGVPCLTRTLGRAASLYKLSCCKVMHCHCYCHCGEPCCLHLGGCGSNCWSSCCGHGLVKDSNFIPSLGYNCPFSFVTCLWGWC